MRIVLARGPGVLTVEDAEQPEPGPGELLVAVTAAGVSLPVVRAVAAGVGPRPYSPGGEVAGRVVALGPGSDGWRVGQRVVGVAFGGAYAEFAAVPAAFAAPVPDGIEDGAAVALLRNGQVALGALRAGRCAAGDRVLVTAAAGGVGHLAVQLARELGASRVIAASRSPAGSLGDGPGGRGDRAAFLRELGADEVVSYADAAPAWTVEADVVLDGAGGPALRRGVAALAPAGRLVSYSAEGGPVEVNELRVRAAELIGFAVAHLAQRHPDRYAAARDHLWDLVAAGRLRPHVHAEFPLADAARAHDLVRSRRTFGKLVLLPRVNTRE